jgi:YidC/Oxa1 family membrane protein insertase
MKQENESPFSNPRFLLVLAVTFIGLWGWQYFVNKNYPAVPVAVVAASASSDTTKAASTADVQKAELKKGAVLGKNEVAAYVPEQFIYTDENVSFVITSLGFGFTSFNLNDYKDHSGNQVQFVNDDAFFALRYRAVAVPFKMTVSEDKLTYTGTALVDGKELKRTVIYNKEQKSFLSTIQIAEGLEELEFVIEQNKIVSKSTNFLMPSFDHQDFVYSALGKTHSERITGIKDNEALHKPATDVTMASVGSQYFVSALVNKSDISPKILNKVEGKKATLSIVYNTKDVKISELKQIIYVGAKKTEVLEAIDATLPEVLNYGIFGFISKALLLLMKYIYSFVGNWGVAIIILTIVVRTVLLPFNIMSFRSAQAMTKIKPKMDAIKERYKGDPVRLNKETMALMKENNANPLSGCLPMLLQIPIFFAFFATISTSVELYHQPFMGWITDLSTHDPFFILPILMGVTMFFQQKLTPTTMDPMQAKILNFMPLIFTLFMVTLPSGLTLYNFISALFGVVQQYFLLKDSKSKNL